MNISDCKEFFRSNGNIESFKDLYGTNDHIDLDAKAIVACSLSGMTARMVSRFRSPVPIIGLTVAYWAAKVLQGRPNADDALSVEAAQLIEYVSSRANRYDIQRLANRLKNDTTIDSHIRALLTYHEIY